jgi:hypothetical protein
MGAEHNNGESHEDRHEPNYRFRNNWENIFRKIPGLENSTWLRRVRCPNRRGEMDFQLLTAGSDAKMALVELVGHDRSTQDRPIGREGTNQLAKHIERSWTFGGAGRTILEESIKKVFSRRREDTGWPGGILEWARKAAPETQCEKHIVELLDAASMNLVAVLLCYRRSILTEEEYIRGTWAGTPLSSVLCGNDPLARGERTHRRQVPVDRHGRIRSTRRIEMCGEARSKRKGMLKVDLTPVDRILALVHRLSSLQRLQLENRIADHPGAMRAQMGAWAFLNREALNAALPPRLRPHVPRFWIAVDEVCRRNDRRVRRIPRCCREGLWWAKQHLRSAHTR